MGWFGSLFSSSPKLADPDFINPVKTDVHSHLIPGIDDGVKTLDESLIILKELSSLGYKKVITTPHIMGDFYKNSPENILPILEEVRIAIKQEQIDIDLYAAAEYMIDDALDAKIKSGSILSFGDNYVLVEMPVTEQPPILKQILFDLQLAGYKPVLAHPERYGFLAKQKNRYEELFESGLLFQINLYSLIGYYSPEIQKTAEWLIEQKMVNMVGSDTHGVRHLDAFHAAIRSKNYQKLCELPLLNNSL